MVFPWRKWWWESDVTRKNVVSGVAYITFSLIASTTIYGNIAKRIIIHLTTLYDIVSKSIMLPGNSNLILFIYCFYFF